MTFVDSIFNDNDMLNIITQYSQSLLITPTQNRINFSLPSDQNLYLPQTSTSKDVASGIIDVRTLIFSKHMTVPR